MNILHFVLILTFISAPEIAVINLVLNSLYAIKVKNAVATTFVVSALLYIVKFVLNSNIGINMSFSLVFIPLIMYIFHRKSSSFSNVSKACITCILCMFVLETIYYLCLSAIYVVNITEISMNPVKYIAFSIPVRLIEFSLVSNFIMLRRFSKCVNKKF